MNAFQIGDRVEVDGYSDYWDGPATVQGVSAGGYINIRSDTGRFGGFSPEYVRPLAPQVVFEFAAEPTYQIAFSDKRCALELSKAEARQVFKQLEGLI